MLSRREFQQFFEPSIGNKLLSLDFFYSRNHMLDWNKMLDFNKFEDGNI